MSPGIAGSGTDVVGCVDSDSTDTGIRYPPSGKGSRPSPDPEIVTAVSADGGKGSWLLLAVPSSKPFDGVSTLVLGPPIRRRLCIVNSATDMTIALDGVAIPRRIRHKAIRSMRMTLATIV